MFYPQFATKVADLPQIAVFAWDFGTGGRPPVAEAA
jgi:hypothetical protein